jgi:hypothetical protein
MAEELADAWLRGVGIGDLLFVIFMAQRKEWMDGWIHGVIGKRKRGSYSRQIRSLLMALGFVLGGRNSTQTQILIVELYI